MTLKAKLLGIIRKQAYREGDFTLASGKKSSFYVDLKHVTLDPVGLETIASLSWETLLGSGNFDAVGGPTLGADPLSTGLSLWAWLKHGVRIPAAIIRKEPKKHGTTQWVEGKGLLAAGARMLILEDVVTTGKSSREAIEKARAEGFVVTDLLCVLDRGEGGEEALRTLGVRLHRLAHIDEVRNHQD